MFEKRKVDLETHEIEPQEIFLDSSAQNQEKQFGLSEKKLETPISKNILQGLFVFVLILNLFLLAKTAQYQIVQGENLSTLSERNKFKIYQIKAGRGVIYDSEGKQLVWNKPSFDLILDKKSLPQSDSEKTEVLKEISWIIGKNLGDLKKEIEQTDSSEILISEDISHEKLILFEAKSGDLPGFQIRQNTVRDYGKGTALSHIIGYTGKIKSEELKNNPDFYTIFDWVGKFGLEKYYEEVLRKSPGKLRVEKDALGNLISEELISLPEPGKSLALWIDSGLQERIVQELEKVFQNIGAKKAAAVALNPKTGGVMALVSLPSFDNNLFQKGGDPKELDALLVNPLKSLFNRAISGKYLVGSTIKPFIASAALEEKIISPEKNLYTKGFIEIPHRYDPDITYQFKDWTNHGWVDMRKAIAQSSNVYFYTIGGGYEGQKGLGPTKIKEYLELFGWNEKTGIDLPGEAEGFIPDVEWKKETLGEGWWDGDTYNLSIGQGYILITPMEVATAFGVIANGGTFYRPKVVKEIIDGSFAEKKVVEKIEPEIIRQNFISPQNIQIVREGMRQAVSGENSPLASAATLNSLPVTAAAKTGTAELGGDRYNNWVTVFAPYENPEIVLTLIIEDIKGLQGAVLPAAKGILEWYFTR